MSKNNIDEKNISATFSTLKDYQKNRIVKAISEYPSINERNANTTFESCPKCGKEDAYITRCGHTRGGKQMLLCHSCGKKFVEDTGKPSF